jgi:hypothetical protein
MSKPRTELLKGTLDLLILRTLELRGMHGAAIAERIEQTTNGTFQVKPGSLFPALHRLEQEVVRAHLRRPAAVDRRESHVAPHRRRHVTSVGVELKGLTRRCRHCNEREVSCDRSSGAVRSIAICTTN